ncbi:MAG TPA: zeta toxin family protein [Mariniphaga sp.]|nr:zeta toxin family protein [Mariniphaga sp.]
MKTNKLIIVGGANGVGKTTFAYQYSDEYKIKYLGADAIAVGIDKTKHANIELKAGKLFFKELDEYYTKNKSVIIESTLSGIGLAKRIEKFKKNGFIIHLLFVFLDDVNLCKNRVAARVKKGGHNVPEKDIERRFNRSFSNFNKIYLPIADTWQIVYNGFKRPIEIAFGNKDFKKIIDEEYYRIFMEHTK